MSATTTRSSGTATTMLPPPLSSLASTPPPAGAGASADPPPAALLRGTKHGLELLVAERATIDEICAALLTRLEASPAFFAGNDVTLRLNGARLPVGSLTRIETLLARFGLRIAEVRAGAAIVASAPASTAPACPAADPPGTARLHVGPVRSGVILEVPGDVVVLGDVNPGAEVRARGSITVMGALRGLAHAGCGESGAGYIVALRLDAPQVRIGQLIARAGDSGAGRGAEIAYATGGKILVESYQGKLPAGVASATAARR